MPTAPGAFRTRRLNAVQAGRWAAFRSLAYAYSFSEFQYWTRRGHQRRKSALLGPDGLSIAAARRVVQAIEEPPESLHDLLGVAATSVLRTGGASGEELRVHELMRRWGWQIDRRDHPFHVALEDSLRALDEAGFELSEGALDFYVEHMHQIAQYEIDSVPTDSPTAAVRYVVLGTVLIEPLILALRRLAQAEASARRFG
jgi:hypothetical protein